MDKNNDMKDEYSREELGDGVRGKYFERNQLSTNIVVLDPDVAEAFPNTKAVNDALRKLIQSQG